MASTSNDASSTSINTKKLRRALLKTLPKRRTPVDLGILVKYWPLGEMEGTRKDQAFLKGLTDERVKCGEYNSQYKAYPIFLSKKVGSSASSKTRAFCPAAYRPALRILNCRIAFTLVGLETKPDLLLMNKRRPASPDVENVADEVAALSDSDSHRLVAEKYALCRDGYLRNVQYHTVVHREFFAWLDKTYYEHFTLSHTPTWTPHGLHMDFIWSLSGVTAMTSQVHMESMWNMWTSFCGSSGTPDAPIWNSRCIYLDSVVHVDFMWSPCGVHQNHVESASGISGV